MDQTLRCNNQLDGYCRKALTEEAVVTTCSHIFCLDCATKTQFANAPHHQRVCPVCRTALPNRDDAIRTQLSPSEDYKTSVLSGLDPATIMDCASRALSFWTYQTTQEIFYQEHLGKILKDKYSQLSTAMDKIINEANTEISTLQDKINNFSLEQRTLQDKYDDLANLYREKSKKAAQSQQLYDALKKKVLRRSVETAASGSVNQTIQSLGAHNAPDIRQEAGISEQQHPQFVPTEQLPRHPQHDLHGASRHRVCHTPHRSSDSGRHGNIMRPPTRTAATRLGQGQAFVNTPAQRQSLPVTGRATAVRSQIPISSSRQDPRPHTQMHEYGSVSRHSFTRDENPRAGAATPRGFGLVEGMKVGRGGAVGELPGEPRFSRLNAMI